jgi:Zn ribbon nucleic-acid-binding protein
MANVNCLENKRCPKCGHPDEIVVYASMWVSVQDDGTDPFADSTKICGGVDYDETSSAKCPECSYEGKLGDWTVATSNDGGEP